MPEKKVTLLDLQRKKQQHLPITMLTAYDYTGGLLVDAAGIDVILVGDSLGMVMLGRDSTVSVTMEEMLHHCRAVANGAQRAHLVGDMPFMAYQADPAEAVRNAARFLKEAAMDAVKLEGGREMASTVRRIVDAGIPVMGHIGLTPQTLSRLGGYRVQGKTAAAAVGLLADAQALEEAGCYALVLEAVPAPVATAITERIGIPTIGIGAGPGCNGQVLVFHDVLGLYNRVNPRFVKEYVNLRAIIQDAFSAYRDDVVAGRFPADDHTYPMDDAAAAEFQAALRDGAAG
jgi:3-methyl-2-oxobutanoate hydroxymethyltransferase